LALDDENGVVSAAALWGRPPGDDVEAIAREMLDYVRTDPLRISFRDLDEYPDQRRRITSGPSTSYRAVADRKTR